ncbi:MAG: Txe/YoeB family addiction module toxin [Bacteroidetes bacterium]|jgi:toxin YoeB|nr:Txe/YoeB family addiction module toxin [Bacteroidota bacterium]
MAYDLDFTDEANEDINFHKKVGDKTVLKKIFTLLEELTEHPYTGTGKPEQLKHYEIPTWSRRITSKHRLVYRIEEHKVVVFILSARGHYDNI